MKKMNKRRIRITKIDDKGKNHNFFCENVLMLRTAKQVGDEEVINNTVLGNLLRWSRVVEFEVLKD